MAQVDLWARYSAWSKLDVIMMRKDPPFDQEYIYATYLLERAESMGVYVVNKRNRCEMQWKTFLLHGFHKCCAETLVAREPARIRSFLLEQEKLFKTLDGRRNLYFSFASKWSNLSVILETMTQYNSRYVMAQKYLPEIKDAISVSCW